MGRLHIFTIVAVLLALITYKVKHHSPVTIAAGEGLQVPKTWFASNLQPHTPIEDRRSADQTFLTYPEWFLVFSPAEQATYFKSRTSTTFPYTGHVKQLWDGYKIAYHQIKDNYKFNTGYHVMIWVIAGSTTVEYSLKALYETLVGGFTDTGAAITDEDKFNAGYMQRYVSFIETTPWYDYDFLNDLKRMWQDTPISGGHLLRKLERRYYLTTELLVKAGYGWLIKLGTQSAYDEALLNTAVVADRPISPEWRIAQVKFPGDVLSGQLVDLPRYAPFKTAAVALAKKGINYREIAGNSSAILLTVIGGKNYKIKSSGIKQIFTQPVLTQPGKQRVALVTTVGELGNVLRSFSDESIEIEHIYDY